MLALRAARMPLVNPAAYSFATGSLWMTTSRYAAKNLLARRDPRAAFFVDAGSKGVLMRGTLEVFDPLSLSNQVRAALAGPGLYLGARRRSDCNKQHAECQANPQPQPQ